MPDHHVASEESATWKSWAAPAIAAFIGSVGGVLVQQYFVPRKVRLEQLAELRSQVVERQYDELQQAKMLAETGLEEGGVVVQMNRILKDQDGNVIRQDTVHRVAPAILLGDSSLQARWDRLADELRGSNQLHPAVEMTLSRLSDLRQQSSWAVDSSATSDARAPIVGMDVQRWWDLHERLLRQADSLLALRF